MCGFIYWGTHHILIKIENPLFEKISPILLFDLLPLIFGFTLIVAFKGRAVRDIFYCPIIIIVYYFIDLVQNYVSLLKLYDAIAVTWHFFRIVGSVSIILSILGGAMSIYFNRKHLIKELNTEY